MIDVIAGHVTCMFDILVTALPQIRAGKVRALAVTSAKRSPFAPDIPTMAESGVAGYARRATIGGRRVRAGRHADGRGRSPERRDPEALDSPD